jgi:hypothetical protein
MVSCLAVLRQEEAAKKARQDFVAAARKAGIFIQSPRKTGQVSQIGTTPHAPAKKLRLEE